ncbi:MAG: hypothetical protein R3D29_07960 [Nitratireductor sp.]
MLLRYGPVYGVPLGVSVMGAFYGVAVALSLLATGLGLAFRARLWGRALPSSVLSASCSCARWAWGKVDSSLFAPTADWKDNPLPITPISR